MSDFVTVQKAECALWHCIGTPMLLWLQGMRRVAMLREVQWWRQVDEMGLLPSEEQLHRIDKRLGGELSLGDVLGGCVAGGLLRASAA
jgi:hypothetical protein